MPPRRSGYAQALAWGHRGHPDPWHPASGSGIVGVIRVWEVDGPKPVHADANLVDDWPLLAGALTACLLWWGSVCHNVEREASRFIPSTRPCRSMDRRGGLGWTARAAWGALLALGLVLVDAPTTPAPRQEKSGLINYMSDYAGVLGSADQRALESELTTIDKTAGYQMVVIVYPRLPDGISASDTTELADRLLVGSSLEDRGLVLFLFVAQKLVRLEVGYGLEALLPDAKAQQIVDAAAARFAQGDYAGGVHQAVASTREALDNLPALHAKARRIWLPDWIVMYIDAAKGLAFLAKHAREIPRQLGISWRAQGGGDRLAIGGLAVVGGLLLVFTGVRPAIGMLLCFMLPAGFPRSYQRGWRR